MKGISPLTGLLALVLLAIVILSLFVFSEKVEESINLTPEEAWLEGCQLSKSKGCAHTDFTPTGILVARFDPSNNDVKDLCISAYEQGCEDNTLYDACWRALGKEYKDISGAACRFACCGKTIDER